VIQQGIRLLQQKLAAVIQSLSGAGEGGDDGDGFGADGARTPDATGVNGFGNAPDPGFTTPYGQGNTSVWGGQTPYGATPYGQSGWGS
jgi:DNA-directed RNA polymerase II subunit RPB3